MDVDPTPAGAPLLLGAPPDRGVVPLAATPPASGAAVVPEPAPVPTPRHGASTDEQRRKREELISIRPPLPGATVMRMVAGVGMGMLVALSLAAGVLLLLLWQQDRSSGVLSTQVDRTWELVDQLQRIEAVVALLIVPFATAWAAIATLNVRRVTGARRNPLLVAVTIPAAVALAWLAGDRVAGPAEDWVGTAVGVGLQVLALAIPLVALERVAAATEAARRPLRTGVALCAVGLAHLWVLDALSTIEESADPADWGRLGAYLLTGALVMAMAALALNEGGRSIEDAALHRFNLRRTFGATIVGAANQR